jgi:hypothetical protein
METPNPPALSPDAEAELSKDEDRSRTARGFNAGLCTQCRTGLAPDEKKTYNGKCAGCYKKKEGGLRTGLEPAAEPRGKMRRMMPVIRRPLVCSPEVATETTGSKAES